MDAAGIQLRTSVRLESAPEGILVSPEGRSVDGAAVRRVVASGQVVIPRKLMDAHAIKDTGRVYIAHSTRRPGALVIIPEALVAGPVHEALLI